ncbi:endonuclease domain-containing protein [Fibrella aquatilis]|uniref:Endonuclease domain-containing protein n=1 Tax=Fibrella aquatilis TaxID=2817059 RepID=A0A939G5W5_9BACT|nr:endonuclease domain-containing protein [Fibrella aquatilis]MBO0932719.1 endonuclease domain-containing protein [Fibrella aquatilis]
MSQLIHNRKTVEDVRRLLRKNQTRHEALLWDRLRSSQLKGRKFRRQHSVGMYILDFYCPAERLAVEIDGDSHTTEEARQHDVERDATMTQLCIHTLRITNYEVETDIEAVLTKISAYFN